MPIIAGDVNNSKFRVSWRFILIIGAAVGVCFVVGLLSSSPTLADDEEGVVILPGSQLQLQTISSPWYLYQCSMRPNHTYKARVRACAGGTCSDWSKEISFTTDPVPEPVSPYDPDWQSGGYAMPSWDKTEAFPIHIDWCDGEGAKSYYIKNFRYPPGEEKKEERKGEKYCLADFCPTIIHPLTIRKPSSVLKSENWFSLEEFTKGTLYDWQVATCLEEDGTRCGLGCPPGASWDDPCTQLSQKWSFFGELELSPPELVFPKGHTVNMLDSLKWHHAAGANSYHYTLWGSWIYSDGRPFGEFEGGGIVEVRVPKEVIEVPFKDLWVDFFVDAAGNRLQLKPNSYFKWRVKSCWSRIDEEPHCEETYAESDFYTTGAPPTNLNADKTIIPVKFDWDDMPGAASYYYEVATDPEFSNLIIPEAQRVEKEKSEILVDYPDLKQNTNYWWRVKTCADKEGKVCGDWSETKSFVTFTLDKPQPIQPAEGKEFYTYERYLRWSEVPGARAYQYRVDDGPPIKVSLNSVFVDTPRELELGEHSWQVRACLDENCQEVGEFGGPWRFEVIAKTPPGKAGLVPCGRDVNLPDPYDIDETEPCGLHHLFLLLRNILDFVLWRLGLIILVLLVVYSGVIFYFAGRLGFPEPLSHLKSLWKAAGLGYLIVFVGYSLINLFLAIMGYKIGIFGPWWIISFK